jgi:hypothetical protein
MKARYFKKEMTKAMYKDCDNNISKENTGLFHGKVESLCTFTQKNFDYCIKTLEIK